MRRSEPPLERRRICSADAKPEQIRSRRDAIDRERAVTAEPAHPILGGAHGAAVALAEAVEIVPRDDRERPDVIQSAAKHATTVIHAIEEFARSGENRAGRGVEILVERDVDGVEGPRILGDALSGVGGLQKETRAVEMQPDAFPPRERDDLLQLGGVEIFALF